jgi:hypothetical protein
MTIWQGASVLRHPGLADPSIPVVLIRLSWRASFRLNTPFTRDRRRNVQSGHGDGTFGW